MVNSSKYSAFTQKCCPSWECHQQCISRTWIWGLGARASTVVLVLFVFSSNATWIYPPAVLPGVSLSLLRWFGDIRRPREKPALPSSHSGCSRAACTCWILLPLPVQGEQGDVALLRAGNRAPGVGTGIPDGYPRRGQEHSSDSGAERSWGQASPVGSLQPKAGCCGENM